MRYELVNVLTLFDYTTNIFQFVANNVLQLRIYQLIFLRSNL